MLYSASFSELFVGALVLLGWSRWLRPRFPTVRFLPPLLLTVLGVAIVSGATAVQAGDTDRLAEVQRAAFGAELVSLVLLVAWTVLALGRGTPDDGDARDDSAA